MMTTKKKRNILKRSSVSICCYNPSMLFRLDLRNSLPVLNFYYYDNNNTTKQNKNKEVILLQQNKGLFTNFKLNKLIKTMKVIRIKR